jgi:hypothetical protein
MEVQNFATPLQMKLEKVNLRRAFKGKLLLTFSDYC